MQVAGLVEPVRIALAAALRLLSAGENTISPHKALGGTTRRAEHGLMKSPHRNRLLRLDLLAWARRARMGRAQAHRINLQAWPLPDMAPLRTGRHRP